MNDLFCILKDGKSTIDLEYLNSEYGIKSNIYPDRVVLNYHQIKSHSKKFHPIVRICRQLILNRSLDEVLHRSFDRFFNYGENSEYDKDFDFSGAVCEEKLDGSLIGIYFDGEKWCICSKTMAYAEGYIPSNFKGYKTNSEVIKNEIDLSLLYKNANKDFSYIFELVTPYNPHVTKYTETRMVLLAVRNKKSGEYIDRYTEGNRIGLSLENYPKIYSFDSVEDIIQMASKLPNFEEGYVCVSKDRKMVKIKNPAHVAASHIKGNKVTFEKIICIVNKYEESEFIKYFPELKKDIESCINIRNFIKKFYTDKFFTYKNIENSKDFARAVKNIPFKEILFQMYHEKKDINDVFEFLTKNHLVRIYKYFYKDMNKDKPNDIK